MPDKPLIFANKTVSDAEKHWAQHDNLKTWRAEPPLGGWDSSYVPGYSDERHYWSAKGEVPIEHMDARLQWVRAVGENDYRGWMPWARMDYVLVRVEDDGTIPLLDKHGWERPPAAQVMPDGTLRRDDTLLAYCDGDTARKHHREERAHAAKVRGDNPPEVPTGYSEGERKKIKLTDEEAVFS